ncbi:MAG: hypothetical protein AMJ63_00590 [Myxococcales bacterium SG8_38_1]|nr:MAG: hypothetical protein AMJ63_00590 [Myxococcales bacterium SG8_38_1]
MIKAELDKAKGVLHARPSGPLEAADFDRLAALADPYIQKKGELTGLMIEAKEFPGWKDFAGMIKHFRFVRNHHRKIRRVALVTDARLGKIAEKLARHFVAAQVKRFPAGHAGSARTWLTQSQKAEAGSQKSK